MEKIKLLREKSGAGMVDCKKALDEAQGDIDKAMEILRKKGIVKAAKRSERETQEGVVKMAVSADNKTGYILEINAETDFVVRSAKFQDYADKVINLAKENKPKDLAQLMSLDFGQGTVKDELDSLSGIIGEKLDLKRYDMLETSGSIASYSHLGGKIGVIVALDQAGKKDLAYEIAMQIAAASPEYVRPEDVPAEKIAKEKDIYREELLKQGKPENMIEKIIIGKLNKLYEQICLVKQEYIKDDEKRVEDILGGAKVEKFIRYSL